MAARQASQQMSRPLKQLLQGAGTAEALLREVVFSSDQALFHLMPVHAMQKRLTMVLDSYALRKRGAIWVILCSR